MGSMHTWRRLRMTRPPSGMKTPPTVVSRAARRNTAATGACSLRISCAIAVARWLRDSTCSHCTHHMHACGYRWHEDLWHEDLPKNVVHAGLSSTSAVLDCTLQISYDILWSTHAYAPGMHIVLRQCRLLPLVPVSPLEIHLSTATIFKMNKLFICTAGTGVQSPGRGSLKPHAAAARRPMRTFTGAGSLEQCFLCSGEPVEPTAGGLALGHEGARLAVEGVSELSPQRVLLVLELLEPLRVFVECKGTLHEIVRRRVCTSKHEEEGVLTQHLCNRPASTMAALLQLQLINGQFIMLWHGIS